LDIDDPEEKKRTFEKFLEEFRDQTAKEKEKVIESGGLHVIGTERHEARRIDNQLRGRSGRQGDPGSSRFYLSLEDDLMRIFGSDTSWYVSRSRGSKVRTLRSGNTFSNMTM